MKMTTSGIKIASSKLLWTMRCAAVSLMGCVAASGASGVDVVEFSVRLDSAVVPLVSVLLLCSTWIVSCAVTL